MRKLTVNLLQKTNTYDVARYVKDIPNRINPSAEEKRIWEVYEQIKAKEQERKSCLIWTTHKCASTFVSNILKVIEDNTKWKTFSYAGCISKLGEKINVKSPFSIETTHCDILYREYGEVYGPLRTPFDFDKRNRMTNIFFLRDPRDVLVSAYYSFGFSHSIPRHARLKKAFLKSRERIQNQGIDAFVLEKADSWVKPYYEKYRDMKNEAHCAFYFSYDYFKDDTHAFIEDLLHSANISGISKKEIGQLAKEATPVQTNKGTIKHKRSGESRQFEKELKGETTSKLNKELESILTFWGFSV